MTHAELLQRHRAVMPDWLALYYDQPIEIVVRPGPPGDRRRGQHLPRLLRRHPHQHARLRRARGRRGDQGAGRPRRRPHLDAVPASRTQIELAEKIAALSGIPDAKVFFTSSGTEANEAALLLATPYRRSNQVLALRNSYHGRSFATMGDHRQPRLGVVLAEPGPRDAAAHGGYRYRSPFRHLSDEDYIAACAADLRDVIDTTTAGDVACMIAEPIQGVGGFAVPPDGLFAAYAEVLDEHGILFISDEVQTGWGRTGEHFWGFQAHGSRPTC